MSLVDTGPPRTSPMGSESEWPGECHGNRSVCRNAVGPPEWECEAMGSVLWVQCATSVECILNLSIAAPADMGPVRSWSHCGSTIKIIT